MASMELSREELLCLVASLMIHAGALEADPDTRIKELFPADIPPELRVAVIAECHELLSRVTWLLVESQQSRN